MENFIFWAVQIKGKSKIGANNFWNEGCVNWLERKNSNK